MTPKLKATKEKQTLGFIKVTNVKKMNQKPKTTKLRRQHKGKAS